MKIESDLTESRISGLLLKLWLTLILNGLLFISAIGQNALQDIPDGGFVRNWLISGAFPAEVDAGMWENFNRFNIETLPQKDWLKPFGQPQPGTFKGTVQAVREKTRAVDSNGNSAPIVLALTTGTIVTRNANGVLVSLTGQPRASGSGQLRLVGIAKIPVGFRNGAEQQLVSVDVVGSLTFASPTSARNASDAASAGDQENL